MNNKQRWTIIFLSFILALALITSGLVYGSLRSIETILSAPAITSEFDIAGDVMLEMSEDGNLQLEYIHLNRISGKISSKIIDLILLVLDD